jgi:hypothetical protein
LNSCSRYLITPSSNGTRKWTAARPNRPACARDSWLRFDPGIALLHGKRRPYLVSRHQALGLFAHLVFRHPLLQGALSICSPFVTNG